MLPATRIVILDDGEPFRVPATWTDPVDIDAARALRKAVDLRRIGMRMVNWGSLEIECRKLARLRDSEEYWGRPENRPSYQAQQQMREERARIECAMKDSALIVLREFIQRAM